MILDTGATASIVGLGTWVSIGKPQLNQTKRTMSDTSNSSLDLKGEFIAEVKYNGRPFQLTLLVSNKFQIKNIIGTDWFPSLDFDFNAVFDNIQFPAPTAVVIDVLPKIKAFKAISFDFDTASSSAVVPKMTGDIQTATDNRSMANKKPKNLMKTVSEHQVINPTITNTKRKPLPVFNKKVNQRK